MAIPVLILGESGTGKSASLRNFKPEDLKVINVANKPLPFKNKFESISTDDYRTIIKELKLNKKKVAVIDDAQYLMANEFMRRATERGFDKFTEIAQNFWTLVNTVKDLPADQVVYFLAHIERDANGNEKIKTIGKLLDEKITVEGMFTIVLKTNVTDGVYSFITQNSGHDTVKSPIGMFPSIVIDNDLKYVDEKIRNYYEIGDFLTDDEMKEIDEAAKKDDIPIADEKPKRGRKRAKKEELEDTPQEEKKEETAKPDPTADVQPDTDAGSETTKKRRRKSREKVMEENAEKVANAGIEEAGDEEEVPFEEVEMPEPEKLPRRKRRGADSVENPSQKDVTDAEDKTATATTTSADPVPEETAAPRRRRRRG
jgi:hypothetical protein|nr:MAG TPA: AAA domain protein [Caudoviricetes sp.]